MPSLPRHLPLLALATACLLSACTPKAAVRISVIPDVPADLESQVLEALTTAPEERCALPCVVQVARGTTHRVTLRATGYYPATFDLPYAAAETMASATSGAVASLAVPLVACEAQPGEEQ